VTHNEQEYLMKNLLKAAALLVVCFTANSVFAGDCSEVSNEIGINRKNPKELRKLVQKSPQCGEIWEALGDYFYEKKVWNEAYVNYEEAKKLLPDKAKLSSRLQELRPKVTELIKDEKELLSFRRRIGGTTSLPPGSSPGSGGSPAAAPPEPTTHGTGSMMLASNYQPSYSSSASNIETTSEPARPATTAKGKSGKKAKQGKMALASKSASSSPTAAARAHSEKIGLMVNFDYNSAEIKPESRNLLADFAEMLKKELAGQKIRVQGHTDNQGGREYNIQLSEQRARSVKDYLQQNGIEASRLETRGYGFAKPIYDNETESGRSKNRRVEFETR